MSLTLLSALLNNAWLPRILWRWRLERNKEKGSTSPRGTQGSGWHPARTQPDLETLKKHVMGTVNATFINLD